jgi:hypothetical protein
MAAKNPSLDEIRDKARPVLEEYNVVKRRYSDLMPEMKKIKRVISIFL